MVSCTKTADPIDIWFGVKTQWAQGTTCWVAQIRRSYSSGGDNVQPPSISGSLGPHESAPKRFSSFRRVHCHDQQRDKDRLTSVAIAYISNINELSAVLQPFCGTCYQIVCVRHCCDLSSFVRQHFATMRYISLRLTLILITSTSLGIFCCCGPYANYNLISEVHR